MRAICIASLLLAAPGVTAASTFTPGSASESPYEFTKRLQKESSWGLDLALLGLSRKVKAHDGYREGALWWCPRARGVFGVKGVADAFKGYCRARGGKLEEVPGLNSGNLYCSNGAAVDSVLFLVQLTDSRKCSDVQTADVTLIEPSGGLQDPGYVRALREKGWRSLSDVKETGRLSREQDAMAYARLLRSAEALLEASRRDAQRRQRDALTMQKVGTTVCKDERSWRYKGFVEQFVDPKVKIRVSWVFQVTGMDLTPVSWTEQIIWDLPTNWYVCE